MIRILLLSLLFLLGGCVSKESSLTSAKEHMIESDKLKELMREMDMVVYDRLKSELQRDNIRRRYALTLVDEIKKLAFHVEEVDHYELSIDTANGDMKLFKSYAKELYKNAQEIRDIAQNYELEKLPTSLKNIEKTCNSCHIHFRDGK